MGGRVEGDAGKIQEVIRLHDEYPSAVEASLIGAGLRWRSVESSSPRRRVEAWADITAVLESLPYDAPLRRAMDPEFWFWQDPAFQYVALIAEGVSAIAAKQPNYTKASRRDFLKVKRPGDSSKQSKTIGSTAMPLAELDAWLAGDFEETSE